MDLVDEVMGQQVVPEGPAAGDQDIFAGLALELGQFLVDVAAPEDADILPLPLQRIGDDDALDVPARRGELTLRIGPRIGGRVLGDLGPEALEQLPPCAFVRSQ